MKPRIIVIILLIFLGAGTSHAQPYSYLLKDLPETTPFKNIQRIVNAYYDTADRSSGSGYKQWKRQEWWTLRHLDPTGKYIDPSIKVRSYTEAKNELKRFDNLPNTPSTHALWSAFGPTSIANGNDDLGRVVCIAFHPSNQNIWYLGTPCGGLWKTTNYGGSYTPLTDNMPGLGVASIVIHPSSPNTIYILTGDGNASHRGHYLKEGGTGVYKSTDGGDTWTETGMNYTYSLANYGYKLMMHPNSTTTLFAGTSTGFWRTFDGGTTWTQSASLAGTEITDFEFKPGSASIMYACGYSGSFYKSSDTGRTWSPISIGASGADRMDIAVTPGNVNRVWVLAGPDLGVGMFKGIFTSTSSGSSSTWSTVRTTPNILGYDNAGNDATSQTWRNISLYISPTDDQFMITGGCFIWKSTNGAGAIAKSSGTIHADNHFIVKHPLNSDLFSGCDGGLYKSTDAGVTWNSISAGLQITQFYRFDMSTSSSGWLLAGAQDNSQMRRNGSDAYDGVTCCDGMDDAVDYTNHNIMYGCIQNGGLYKCTNGTDFNAAVTQPTAGDDYWVTNINIHTTVNTTLFFGGSGGIYRSINSGGAWTNIGGSGQDYMAQGTSNPDRMYGAQGLTIRRSDNVNAATPTWTTVSGGANYPTGANMFITGMDVNPDNSSEMWFVCSGYNAGQKVYRTTNMGTDWENMSGSLPNIPIHCIAFEDNNGLPGGAVYVGTEMGVFYRNNSMTDWVPFGNYLPNSPVTDFKIYYGATRYLMASTFGRGIWWTTTYTGCTANYNITWTLEGYKFYEVSDYITSTSTLAGGVGTTAFFKAQNYVRLDPGFTASTTNGEFKAWIANCGTGGIPLMSVTKNILNIDSAQKYFSQPLDYRPEITGINNIFKEEDGKYKVKFSLPEAKKVSLYFKDENNERIAYFINEILKPGSYNMTIPSVHPNKKIKLGIEAGETRIEVDIK